MINLIVSDYQQNKKERERERKKKDLRIHLGQLVIDLRCDTESIYNVTHWSKSN